MVDPKAREALARAAERDWVPVDAVEGVAAAEDIEIEMSPNVVVLVRAGSEIPASLVGLPRRPERSRPGRPRRA